MFWVVIVVSTIVGPFFVEDGVKLNTKYYVLFLQTNFMPWINQRSKASKPKLFFMQDNAPSHAARFTKTFLERKGFKGNRFMEWPAQSPDLNCIENLWGIVKQQLYANGKQYRSKLELKHAVETVLASIESSTIKKLTSSMDSRLIKVLKVNGENIKM